MSLVITYTVQEGAILTGYKPIYGSPSQQNSRLAWDTVIVLNVQQSVENECQRLLRLPAWHWCQGSCLGLQDEHLVLLYLIYGSVLYADAVCSRSSRL
jgi:hypothetical protein